MSVALPNVTNPRRHLRDLCACLGVIMMVALGCAFATALQAPPARALDKGLSEPRLDESSTGPAERAALIREIGPQLHARWVRLTVDWSRLEPKQGMYAASEVARLDSVVDGLRAAHVKVMLTTSR